LENGDPLENNANFGGFPYTSKGFTYNLQDLVTLPYFGAPASTSVNNVKTFSAVKVVFKLTGDQVSRNASEHSEASFFSLLCVPKRQDT